MDGSTVLMRVTTPCLALAWNWSISPEKVIFVVKILWMRYPLPRPGLNFIQPGAC